ncbi:16S rRNA (guanine(966)-N(2))-methyltransferase RsmD [Vagococcus jeotgali]|uniref:16S rRNA (guanine(966)-N(2))-methyltransferase RsmD n=1 Tax=Vagococcus jeotgali TaxID=3109030 RepID=UPI002DDC7D3D|nr:16S rRNA (guanine(966)-N(2))-methyltransferase RsmD [Vagococcus sp. B2T-5]
MRIIAGEFKGRKLQSLKGDNTRPTSDKVKGSIFNRIGPYFDGGTCLDLYSGSGNLAIEAVSRGIDKAYCFDNHYAAVKIIQENINLTKQNTSFVVKKMEDKVALSYLSQAGVSFDLVFLDPPYAKEKLNQILLDLQELALLNDGADVICEMDKHVLLPEEIDNLYLKKDQVYGATRIMIFRYLKEA